MKFIKILPLISKYYYLILRVFIALIALLFFKESSRFVIFINSIVLAEVVTILIDFGLDFLFIRKIQEFDNEATIKLFTSIFIYKIIVASAAAILLLLLSFLINWTMFDIDINLTILWFFNSFLFSILLNYLNAKNKIKMLILTLKINIVGSGLFIYGITNQNFLFAKLILLITALFFFIVGLRITYEYKKLFNFNANLLTTYDSLKTANSFWVTSVLVVIYSRFDLVIVNFFEENIANTYTIISKSLEFLIFSPVFLAYYISINKIDEASKNKIFKFCTWLIALSFFIWLLLWLTTIKVRYEYTFLTYVYVILILMVRVCVVFISSIAYSMWNDKYVQKAAKMILFLHLINAIISYLTKNFIFFLNFLLFTEYVNYMYQRKKSNN